MHWATPKVIRTVLIDSKFAWNRKHILHRWPAQGSRDSLERLHWYYFLATLRPKFLSRSLWEESEHCFDIWGRIMPDWSCCALKAGQTLLFFKSRKIERMCEYGCNFDWSPLQTLVPSPPAKNRVFHLLNVRVPKRANQSLRK